MEVKNPQEKQSDRWFILVRHCTNEVLLRRPLFTRHHVMALLQVHNALSVGHQKRAGAVVCRSGSGLPEKSRGLAGLRKRAEGGKSGAGAAGGARQGVGGPLRTYMARSADARGAPRRKSALAGASLVESGDRPLPWTGGAIGVGHELPEDPGGRHGDRADAQEGGVEGAELLPGGKFRLFGKHRQQRAGH